MKRFDAVACLLFAGCRSGPQTPPPAPEPTPAQPALGLAALSPTERLGYEIYRFDRAAWVATDAARGEGLDRSPVQGWIVVPEPAGLHVRFIGKCGAAACSYADVEVGDRGEVAAVHRLDIPYRGVIHEAVELANSYGGTDGHKCVNGVRDRHAAGVRAVEFASRARERGLG